MSSLRACLLVALASFTSLASVATPLAAQTSVIDVGSLVPNQQSSLWAVNERNQAVGWGEIGGFGDTRALLWEGGRLLDLGMLPGDHTSTAWAINERRQIVGVSVDQNVGRGHAFLWMDGQMTPLTAEGSESCYAFDISDRGDVAGACDRDAIVWSNRVARRLRLPDGYTWGTAAVINDAGVAAGTVQVSSSSPRLPVRWRNGVPALLPLPPGATSATINAINARGVIVGYVTIGAGYEPVLWDHDLPRPLAGRWGGFQGYAWDVNDRDEIAVHGWASPTNAYGGYVWRDGAFHKLEGNGSAYGLNNRGVVVGYIYDESGLLHGAVWPKALTRIPPTNPRPVATGPQAVFLGTLGGPSSVATRINARGQILGYSTVAADRDEIHPFLWVNGVMRDLHADPGGLVSAEDLNDRGQVVGRIANGVDPNTYGALWENGVTTPLPLLPGSNNCFATAINEVGLIAGFCVVWPNPLVNELVGVFWRNGIVERIAAPADVQLSPLDLNDAGVVIGLAFRGNQVSPFLWQDGVLTDIPEATGGALSEIAAINDRGHLAGWGPGGSPIQAFLWDGLVARPLGDPAKSNIAHGLNNLDDVAGAIGRAAAVWRNGGTIEPASPRGYSIAEARAINDLGDVAGNVSVSSTPYVSQAVYWPAVTAAATRSPN